MPLQLYMNTNLTQLVRSQFEAKQTDHAMSRQAARSLAYLQTIGNLEWNEVLTQVPM